MSIAEKLIQAAENEQKVYDAGKQKRTREFWECVTGYGQRRNFSRFLRNSDLTGETLPEDLFTIENAGAMFYNYYGTALPEGVDLANIDTTKTGNDSAVSNIVGYSPNLEEVYDVNIPEGILDYYCSFQNCPMLRKIEKVRSNKDTAFTSTFVGDSNLEEITFEGVIGKNISLKQSTKLSLETLTNLIDCLYDYSGSTATYTCTLGAENLAKLTDEQKLAVTTKGWTLA